MKRHIWHTSAYNDGNVSTSTLSDPAATGHMWQLRCDHEAEMAEEVDFHL